ncbi:hypothetical protein [Dyadobacter sp. 3J3]|uniref:hypothetical protein n=1 Tax=Dyadobacter sp. 3J3 TaxID=2606600 RepID=UPI00135C7E83|nr:hypothetical protein [Dyadobacter sp. 3J3]
MTYQPVAHQVAFVLPLYFWKAEIVFTRIASGAENVTIPIQPGKLPRHVVSTEKLEKGYWRALLNWSDGHAQYYSEKMIEIV